MRYCILFFFINLISIKSFSDELVNEFNFSATIDGLYKLEDGRIFESSTLKGHIKSSMNDGNKVWSVLERGSSAFNAGVGESTIIDATGKFKSLVGTKCLYAVTKFKKSSFIKEKCKLKQGILNNFKD